MSPIAAALISLSTFAHAFWNLLGKRRNPSVAFFLVASLAAGVCLLPVMIIYHQALVLIPLALWGWLLATGFCQGVYFIGLAGAYRHGDMSVAYPLARALPALLVLAVTAMLGLGQPVSRLGYVGIFGVVLGCLLVPAAGFRSLRPSNYLNLCCALACLAACGTTGYTIIDSEALRRLRSLPGSGMDNLALTVLFMALETSTTTLALAAYVLLSKTERAAFASIRRTAWRYAAVTGLIITATYGLVLVAMAFVSNVSYLAAFRELSIPIGALLGVTIQKEPTPAPKIMGIGLVLAGLLMIGLA